MPAPLPPPPSGDDPRPDPGRVAAVAAAASAAVAVLTAWCDDDDSLALPTTVMDSFAADGADSAEEVAANLRRLCGGFVSLSGMLLTHLCDATGTSEAEVLTAYGAHFAAQPPDTR